MERMDRAPGHVRPLDGHLGDPEAETVGPDQHLDVEGEPVDPDQVEQEAGDGVWKALNPHWVSLRPRPVPVVTRRLKSLPMTDRMAYELSTIESASARDPMATSLTRSPSTSLGMARGSMAMSASM